VKILVAGGCGFIGSNFVRLALEHRQDLEIVVYDALTYAGNLANLSDLAECDRYSFVKGDIVDGERVREALAGVEAIVNFAAESHVDRSILDSAPFVRTNIQGTHVLLESARALGIPRFLQVSTDEVYGSLLEGKFTEETPLQPNSPYSASTSAADPLVRSDGATYDLPALIVRSSNAYGPYQFPEKLIPLMISTATKGGALPVYGDGQHVRDWVHVEDFCHAVLTVLERGRLGEVYNVGGGNELPNLDVVRMIISLTGASEEQITFVPDRPGHDRRYAMDHSKLTKELGWEPARDFQAGLEQTVGWYGTHTDWIESVTSGEYRQYFARQYPSLAADEQ